MWPRSPVVLCLLTSAPRAGRTQEGARRGADGGPQEPPFPQSRQDAGGARRGAGGGPREPPFPTLPESLCLTWAAPRSRLPFHFARNGVQSQGMAAGPPSTPTPSSAEVPRTTLQGVWGSLPASAAGAAGLQHCSPFRTFRPPRASPRSASVPPSSLPRGRPFPSPLLRGGWGPAGARGPLTPSDKAPSGSDLQPAVRARPGPSPAPLRSKTGKLKSPGSRTWRRRPWSPPCSTAAGRTRPSGCRGLPSEAPCTHGAGALGSFTAWNPPTGSPFQTVSSGK